MSREQIEERLDELEDLIDDKQAEMVECIETLDFHNSEVDRLEYEIDDLSDEIDELEADKEELLAQLDEYED